MNASDATDPDPAPPEDGPRYALYGGSFDPVHLGHLGVAELAREACGLDRVLFVPCGRSPFKESAPTEAAHRLEMLRLALGERLGGAGGSGDGGVYALSDWEIERPGPSYSWETARHYRRRHPEARWHWILGADQWASLPRWAEPDRLRRGLVFIVAHRSGHRPEPREGWQSVFLPYDHPAASSAIRADFAGCRSWLPGPVAAYCERHRLYGAGRAEWA